MRTAKEFTIDSDKFVLGHWAPDKATEILAWLVQSMGPCVKGGFQAFGENKNLLDMKVEDVDLKLGVEILDVVVANLSKSLAPAEYARRMREILTDDIICNGRPLDYNNHFRGKQKLMHRLALEVIKYQFADFFDGLLLTLPVSDQQKAASSHPLSQVN